MRESKLPNYRPHFRMPLYPWLPILAIFGYGFLLVEMGALPLIVTACFFALGWGFYFFYSKPLVKRKSALHHVVERITSNEMASKTLNTELRGIVMERDEIILDRFDHAIQKCEVLDFDEPPSTEDLFKNIAERLEKKTRHKAAKLYEAFIKREEESCTVVREGLAIPHVLIPGEGIFEVALVRICKGFKFKDSDSTVHTMFVLAGSRDMRIHHLRSLMAIAQVAEEKGFDERWMTAPHGDFLRDIVLLAKRHRLKPPDPDGSMK
jgi:basic amino acid/polyamine antiporter, APA family